jgi:hypothetical protein
MPRRAVRKPVLVAAAEKWLRRHYGNRSLHPFRGFVLCRLASNRPHIATAHAFSTRNADLAEVCSLVRAPVRPIMAQLQLAPPSILSPVVIDRLHGEAVSL